MFDFLFSGWFWGFILIIIGSGAILKNILKIRINLFFVFAVIVIIFFVFNLYYKKDYESVIFVATDEQVPIKEIFETSTFNNMFCDITYDLTQLDSNNPDLKLLEINNLLGSTRILINKSQKVKIESRSFFGSNTTPDEVNQVIGNHVYYTSRYTPANPHLFIAISNIFGKIEVFEK